MLLNSGLTLRVADGRKLTIMDALSVCVSTTGALAHNTKQMLHIVAELSDLYLSKSCLADLNVISHSFPQPMNDLDSALSSMDTSKIAECGCPVRQPASDPPSMPFPPTEDNVDKLKEFIIRHYSSSTMNMCSHQTLPEVSGPARSSSICCTYTISNPPTLENSSEGTIGSRR